MSIDRAQFLPTGAPNDDFPVPLSATCSVPSERMAYLLAGLAGEGDSILEIGTGSGYQTAVLAERWKEVVSLESFPIPGIEARLPSNVMLIHADGMDYDTGEQYDAILVTCGVTHLSPVWINQLKDGGKLVAPIQVGENSCRISVYRVWNGKETLEEVIGYAPFTQAVN